jgi:hypothetical protein
LMLRGRAYGEHPPGQLPAGTLMAVGFGSGHEYLEQMRAHELRSSGPTDRAQQPGTHVQPTR